MRQRRYYPESDGGDFWTGDYWSRNPKTYYVVDELQSDPIMCNSWAQAKRLADHLNARWELKAYEQQVR